MNFKTRVFLLVLTMLVGLNEGSGASNLTPPDSSFLISLEERQIANR